MTDKLHKISTEHPPVVDGHFYKIIESYGEGQTGLVIDSDRSDFGVTFATLKLPDNTELRTRTKNLFPVDREEQERWPIIQKEFRIKADHTGGSQVVEGNPEIAKHDEIKDPALNQNNSSVGHVDSKNGHRPSATRGRGIVERLARKARRNSAK